MIQSLHFSTSGYICTEMIKLDDTVMELRMGQMSITKEYACDKEYFNMSTPTFTLVGKISSLKLKQLYIDISPRWSLILVSSQWCIQCGH